MAPSKRCGRPSVSRSCRVIGTHFSGRGEGEGEGGGWVHGLTIPGLDSSYQACQLAGDVQELRLAGVDLLRREDTHHLENIHTRCALRRGPASDAVEPCLLGGPELGSALRNVQRHRRCCPQELVSHEPALSRNPRSHSHAVAHEFDRQTVDLELLVLEHRHGFPPGNRGSRNRTGTLSRENGQTRQPPPPPPPPSPRPGWGHGLRAWGTLRRDRKSTRLNSSHVKNSYAV